MTAEPKDESPSRNDIEEAIHCLSGGECDGTHYNTILAAYRQAVARAEAEHKRAEELAEIFSGVDDKGYSWVLRGKAAEKERDQAVARLDIQKEDNRNLADQVNRMGAERDALRGRLEESDKLIQDFRDGVKENTVRFEKMEEVVEAIHSAWVDCECPDGGFGQHSKLCQALEEIFD